MQNIQVYPAEGFEYFSYEGEILTLTYLFLNRGPVTYRINMYAIMNGEHFIFQSFAIDANKSYSIDNTNYVVTKEDMKKRKIVSLVYLHDMDNFGNEDDAILEFTKTYEYRPRPIPMPKMLETNNNGDLINKIPANKEILSLSLDSKGNKVIKNKRISSFYLGPKGPRDFDSDSSSTFILIPSCYRHNKKNKK